MSVIFYQAVIVLWIMFFQPRLFQHINELGWYKHSLHSWIDNLKLQPKAKVLELGCATGVLTEYLAGDGCPVTGIDASEKMIQTALSKDNHRAAYQVADAKSLPFKDCSFDAVVSASLLNIIDTPETVIEEMVRVCKKGGIVSILTPKQGFNDSQLNDLIRKQCGSGFSQAALKIWHKRAPKLAPVTVYNWYKLSGLQIIAEQEYLDGMVTTITGKRL